MMTRCADRGPNPRARAAGFVVGAATFAALAAGLPPLVISKGGAVIISALSGAVGVLAYASIRCAMARRETSHHAPSATPATR